MALFDSKQEVINIELTSFGKSKMATGGFKPAYYAFFDDGVIYDGAYADIAESFNGEADIRVRTETPYLRSQASLIGQEFKKIKNPSIKETNEFNNIIKYENENLLKHYLGNTSIGQQTGSRVGMLFLEGEIENVSLTGTLNKFDGREGYNPKRNKITTKTLLFTPEIKKLTNPNLNVPPEIIDPDTMEIPSVSPILNDSTYIKLNTDYVLVYVNEENTEPDYESFEISVYKVGEVENTSGGKDETYKKLTFARPTTSQIDKNGFLLDLNDTIENSPAPTSNNVEYYLNIEVDQEISLELINNKVPRDQFGRSKIEDPMIRALVTERDRIRFDGTRPSADGAAPATDDINPRRVNPTPGGNGEPC
jgi:hypothetical protein